MTSNRLGVPVPYQQILIYETHDFWPHYLLPGICSCARNDSFNPLAPEAGFLITPAEQINQLQSIHWNKLASGYFQDETFHLRHFLTWIYQSWEVKF